jgi:hypothetical protein
VVPNLYILTPNVKLEKNERMHGCQLIKKSIFLHLGMHQHGLVGCIGFGHMWALFTIRKGKHPSESEPLK